MTDATVMPSLARVTKLTAAHNHNAVCKVLRWAKRGDVPVADVELVCAMLGLDPVAAIKEARRR